jgi:hypothetical protein
MFVFTDEKNETPREPIKATSASTFFSCHADISAMTVLKRLIFKPPHKPRSVEMIR